MRKMNPFKKSTSKNRVNAKENTISGFLLDDSTDQNNMHGNNKMKVFCHVHLQKKWKARQWFQ
jgi:hypothetical protein